jgi:hypothetical protein
LLGKNVRCPKCQTTFLAEMDEPAEPERIVREPRPAARRRPRPPEDFEEEDELPPEEELEELPEEPEEEYEERPRRRRGGGRRRAAAEAAVAGPATSLIVLGIIDLVLIVLGILLRVLGFGLLAAGGGGGRGGPNPNVAADIGGSTAYMVGSIIGTIVGILFAVAILMGGLKMKKLESYGSVMTACILAMLPCGNCCLIGLPLGIWALVVLNRPEVKDSFR